MATRTVKTGSEESQGGMGSELGSKVTGTVADTREFLRDVRVEMRQVTWPSREAVIATTWVVIDTETNTPKNSTVAMPTTAIAIPPTRLAHVTYSISTPPSSTRSTPS